MAWITKAPMAALLAVCLVGCVSQGTFDKLKGDSDALVKGMGEQLQSCESDRSLCQKDLEDAQAELARQQSDRAALEERLANVLKDKAELDASVEDMQRALAVMSKRQSDAQRRIEEFKQLVARFQTLIDAGKLQVRIVDGRMVVQMATDVLFGSGSAKLSKEGEEAIREVSAILVEIGGKRYQIEGHTDDIPIKSPKYPSNWHLASGRAMSVLETMLDAGLPASRVSAASFGEHRPVGDNSTDEGRSLNRRIEIVIVPDLSALPGFDELREAGGERI